MRSTAALRALAVLVLAGCSGNQVNSGETHSPGVPGATRTVAPTEFSVTSPAFVDNTQIPVEYSCGGAHVPPPLRWRNAPAGTGSLAVVIDDPDAPAGLYVHWVVTGIPPSVTEITDGALPGEAVVSLNSADQAEYLGPCPPAGTGVHHYRFQVYALSKPLTLATTTPASESTATIAGQATAVARTVGLFGH